MNAHDGDQPDPKPEEAPIGGVSVWAVVLGAPGQVVEAAFWQRADAEAFARTSGIEKTVLEVVVRGERKRCSLCGEPIVLDDPHDEMSWIHATDANDLGDHTAER